MAPESSRELDRFWEHARVHAKLHAFGRRVAQAQAIVREAATRGRCAVMVSGGKDSTALVHLANEVLPGTPGFFFDSGAETPWTHEVIAALRQRGYEIVTVEPEYTIVQMAKMVGWRGYDGPERLPGSWTWRPEDYREILIERPARRVALAGFPVHLIGLRAEENRGRRMNRCTHGVLYPRGDGRWIATPLADWTAQDVFAYLASNDLPVSREYLDPGDTAEERGQRRTGTALGTTYTGYGRWHELRVRHRALWQELVKAFPEMRHDS